MDIRQALDTPAQPEPVQNVSPSLHILSIAPLLHHCSTISLLRCSAAVVQFCSAIFLYCSTAVLYHSTALLLYCSAIQLYCSTPPLHSTSRLNRSTTTSLRLCRLLLYYSSTIPLYILLFYCSTTAVVYHPTTLPSQPTTAPPVYHPPPQLYHPTSINSYQPYSETLSKPLKELQMAALSKVSPDIRS